MLTIKDDTKVPLSLVYTFRSIAQGSIFKFKNHQGECHDNSFCLKVGYNQAVNLEGNPPIMIGQNHQGFLNEGTSKGQMDCQVELFNATLTVTNI